MNQRWCSKPQAYLLAVLMAMVCTGERVRTQQGEAGKSVPAAGQAALRYQPIVWTNEVLGKNFPLLAIIDADQAARRAVSASPALRSVLDAKRKALAAATLGCASTPLCAVETLTLSAGEIATVRDGLAALTRDGSLRSVVGRMRASGLFARDAALDDVAFVGRSWEKAAEGLNFVIGVYGKGDKPHYPAIDAMSHDLASYGPLVHTAVGLMSEQADQWELCFQPSLEFARRLLDINYRDEAGRHEPMHLGENAAAFTRAQTLAWGDYPYTAALVPGAGLSDVMEREHHTLSPMGKMIIEIAARRYFDRKVPFIIVSGGYVHPKHSQWAEAIEMKKSLMRDFKVPEDAIVIDPHARHTTTNVRNAARLMLRYGFPADRPALITTQQYHLDSIAAVGFDDRNTRELGYTPYLRTRRLSRFEVEWTPNVLSLTADPLDPLDP